MFWTRDAYTFGSLGGTEARRRGTDLARGRLVLLGQGATGAATDPRDTRAAGRGRVNEASDKLLVLASTGPRQNTHASSTRSTDGWLSSVRLGSFSRVKLEIYLAILMSQLKPARELLMS